MDTKTTKIIADWFIQKYLEIDQLMIPLSKKCKRGCDWCCYQSVEILNWEKPLILNYISEKLSDNQKTTIKKKLLLWLNYFNIMMPSKNILSVDDVFVKFQQKQRKDRIACPFLHQHNCLIYLVRPLSCRMHVAENGPAQCKANPLNDASDDAISLRKKILEEIIIAVPTRLELLNFAVAPLLGLSNKIKKMDYPLLQI